MSGVWREGSGYHLRNGRPAERIEFVRGEGIGENYG